MKSIKTLLAVSAVLAMASSANAAVYTFNATVFSDILSSGASIGTNTGSGSATLDDTSGLLTIVSNNFYNLAVLGSTASYTETVLLNGTLSGSSFAWVPGTTDGSACVGAGPVGGSICGGVNPVRPFTPTVNPIAFDLSFGGVTAIATTGTGSSGDVITTTYTLTNTTTPAPVIPVPAAAWLFGSGLLGLAGTARRRRAAAVTA